MFDVAPSEEGAEERDGPAVVVLRVESPFNGELAEEDEPKEKEWGEPAKEDEARRRGRRMGSGCVQGR